MASLRQFCRPREEATGPPNGFSGWGIVAVIASALTATAMLTGGAGLSTYSFLIIPVGVGWTIAAGLVLLRLSRSA
ncbi:MAG TPA: hypothetical protein VMO47_09965 [Rhodothermales bacterium]|nr:hypothetical protein [Rhodothermales bacterium]